MDVLKHIRLMAQYNQWMNAKLYETAAKLSPEELGKDRGAFFGSVLGTLNHIMVGDIIWLKRLGTHPAGHRALEPVRLRKRPDALNEILYTDLAALSQERKSLDAIIIAWAGEMTASISTTPWSTAT